jgi:hypothetical protein
MLEPYKTNKSSLSKFLDKKEKKTAHLTECCWLNTFQSHLFSKNYFSKKALT